MELKPGHRLSLLSKKSGASLDIEVKDTSIVVRTQDIESRIEFTSEGIRLETDGGLLIGRSEENERKV
jgi:hypothetical protein